MNLKIDVIIVTFNRKKLLAKTLEKIFAQTTSVNKIFIIDNCSTDGTYEYVKCFFDLKEKNERDTFGCFWARELKFNQFIIDYFFKQENDGGAGGFAFGMDIALKGESDALWIMDDDGFPEPDCLFELSNIFQEGLIEYVSPNLKTFEGEWHFKSVNNNTNYVNGTGGPFNGILVSKNLINNIGLPRKDFFLWGDEREWTQRVINSGYLTVIAKNAIHLHKSTAFDWKNAPRVFFLVRNLVWTARLNDGPVVNKYVPWLDLLYHLRKLTFSSLRVFNINQLYSLIKGLFHGFFTKLK